MSSPSTALHAALRVQPQQTAHELADGLARAGHPPLTADEVERLLHSDPRLRPDGGTPARWRALGAAQPAPLFQVPTPHHSSAHIPTPVATFRERGAPTAAAQSAPPTGVLPAAAFAGRPSVRLHEAAAAREEPTRVTPPAVRVPVRVPVIARPAPVLAPTVEAPPVAAPVAIRVEPPVTAPRVAAPTAVVAAPIAPPPTPLVAAAAPPAVVAPVVAPVAAPVLAAPPSPVVAMPVAPSAPIPRPAAHRVAPESAPVAATPAVSRPTAPSATLPTRPTAIAPPPTADEPAPQPRPASVATDRGPLPPGGDVRYVGPQLRRWQKDVLDAWLAADRRGIVEAVSAQGRAVVGVLAAWDALTRHEKVLVLVPTTDLLEQWLSTLTVQLPGLSVGRRDLTTAHTFDECDVLVSLVSSAFGHDLLRGRPGLLVADDVHRYGSARPAETLRDGFGARLGLTSSIERQDAGVDEVLRPYFGTVLDGCDLRRGRAEGVLARFRLALVPVDLDPAHQAEHDTLTAQITELQERLAAHGCAPATFHDDALRLQGGWREDARAAADASAWLRAVSTRRDLLATATAKIDAVTQLAPLLPRSARGLVFTHTKDDAGAAAARLRSAGVAAAWFHTGQEPETRRTTLRDLRSGAVSVLSTPKVLDEGLDLPTIDTVVILASSRSRRQLVQRVSPALHPPHAIRLPLVVVVHARGTVDADDGVVAELVEVATEVRTFDDGTAGLAAWVAGT